MTADLTGASLFAGIEGFGLAMTRAGIDVTAAVEIDPAARGVIARHFPASALFPDVTKVTADEILASGFVPYRGVLTGGFPCQDLSIAGRRRGLGGSRSGLFWHIMRLADQLRPRWIILENVPGLLSAVCQCPGEGACILNGRSVRCGYADRIDGRVVWIDGAAHGVKGGACPGGCIPTHGGAMGAVLGALGERGYGFAYRVLDAQFFRLAQRRERVFIVASLGDRAGPVQILLEPEGGSRDPAPGRAARPGAAGTPADGANGARPGIDVVSTLKTIGPGDGWRVSADEAAAGQLITAPTITAGWGTNHGAPGHGGKDEAALAVTAATLQGGGRRGHRIDAEGAAGGHLIAHTLTAREGKGADSDAVSGFVPVPLGGAVRRLTPRECERLQGFPDDWTRYLADGREQSDSARYRQLGNAVAVPVVEWIARRLAAVASQHAQDGAA